jgi:indole-3-glycerol phosphate synthase
VLKEICERRMKRVREELTAERRRELRARAADMPAARGFRAALEGATGLGLIAEIKRASPSKGDLNPGLDPAERARAYERGGADALSVLTEQDFFNGSLADLAAARGACGLPVIRKDFILDEGQVWEARAAGADAVLLIVAALGSRTGELRAAAREAGLDVLVEVHGEGDLEHAGDADLVGVNNRDLGTLKVDLGTMAQVLPRVRAGATRVAESGIASAADARAARAAGARALLVGEHLVSLADPGPHIRELKL